MFLQVTPLSMKSHAMVSPQPRHHHCPLPITLGERWLVQDDAGKISSVLEMTCQFLLFLCWGHVAHPYFPLASDKQVTSGPLRML